MDTKDVTLKMPAPGANRIYFHSSIDGSSVLDAVKELRAMDAEMTELEMSNVSKLSMLYGPGNNIPQRKSRIRIMLSSEGGYCYDGFCLYDTISEISQRRPVEVQVSGLCMSMAIPVLLSVPLERRFASKNSVFMIHQVFTVKLGKLADVENDLEETRRIQESIWRIIAENTNITEEQLKNCYECKKDWYITADEALELGLISKII